MNVHVCICVCVYARDSVNIDAHVIAWSCALARAELEDQRREQKKARLHQEWTDKVFNRIQVGGCSQGVGVSFYFVEGVSMGWVMGRSMRVT